METKITKGQLKVGDVVELSFYPYLLKVVSLNIPPCTPEEVGTVCDYPRTMLGTMWEDVPPQLAKQCICNDEWFEFNLLELSFVNPPPPMREDDEYAKEGRDFWFPVVCIKRIVPELELMQLMLER